MHGGVLSRSPALRALRDNCKRVAIGRTELLRPCRPGIAHGRACGVSVSENRRCQQQPSLLYCGLWHARPCRATMAIPAPDKPADGLRFWACPYWRGLLSDCRCVSAAATSGMAKTIPWLLAGSRSALARHCLANTCRVRCRPAYQFPRAAGGNVSHAHSEHAAVGAFGHVSCTWRWTLAST